MGLMLDRMISWKEDIEEMKKMPYIAWYECMYCQDLYVVEEDSQIRLEERGSFFQVPQKLEDIMITNIIKASSKVDLIRVP